MLGSNFIARRGAEAWKRAEGADARSEETAVRETAAGRDIREASLEASIGIYIDAMSNYIIMV